MRKLPIVYGKPLYRGIRKNVVDSNEALGKTKSDTYEVKRLAATEECVTNNATPTVDYTEGNAVVWQGVSSTSPDIKVTKAFLAKGSKSGKAEGTLFIIEGGWGYNIQPYSIFPNEEEIVIEPVRKFRVMNTVEAEGLTLTNLKMEKTPLILPSVFGKPSVGFTFPLSNFQDPKRTSKKQRR